MAAESPVCCATAKVVLGAVTAGLALFLLVIAGVYFLRLRKKTYDRLIVLFFINPADVPAKLNAFSVAVGGSANYYQDAIAAATPNVFTLYGMR